MTIEQIVQTVLKMLGLQINQVNFDIEKKAVVIRYRKNGVQNVKELLFSEIENHFNQAAQTPGKGPGFTQDEQT